MNGTGPLWAAAPLTEQTCSKIGSDEVLRRKWSAPSSLERRGRSGRNPTHYPVLRLVSAHINELTFQYHSVI
jgi:hypothetical protein